MFNFHAVFVQLATFWTTESISINLFGNIYKQTSNYATEKTH